MQGFFMKDYIEERAIEIANYIIEERTTVRQAAKRFGVSKSTIHVRCNKKEWLKNKVIWIIE
jgi:putative DeoR family transcriptional regulator (stage III sporulation protein D)